MKFLIGLGVGYAVGILIAPAAGSETRARLRDKMDSTAREKAKEMGARAGEEAYEKLKKAV